MDRACRIQRGLAVAQRPRTRVLLACGEERDQIERAREPGCDVVERRFAAVAVGGCLVVGQLGELRLELQVDAGRPVHDRDQRLRRQRFELAGQLAGIRRELTAGVDVREHLV